MDVKENRKKWVEALRSGDYKQGIGVLSKGDSFCCLGVLCEVAMKHGVKIEKRMSELSELEPNVVSYDDNTHTAPDAARKWVGLTTTSGDFVTRRKGEEHACFQELTDLNDNGKTFTEIAAIIEEEPEGMFCRRLT